MRIYGGSDPDSDSDCAYMVIQFQIQSQIGSNLSIYIDYTDFFKKKKTRKNRRRKSSFDLIF